MNSKVTITKEKYQELVEKAGRFEVIQKLAFNNQGFFQEPATKNISAIIKGLEKAGKYSKSFLKSLDLGLKKSLLFPQEDLKDYSHSLRIKNSYKKAIKLYPPLSA